VSDGAALRPDVRVGVIGAGTMGAGIARVAAAAGHEVVLFDARDGAASQARAAIATDLERAVGRGKIAADDAAATVERLRVAASLAEFAACGLVIEAIVEDRAAKIALFRELEAIVADDAILATNTSSISVTAIAGALRVRERCVGMHFFNPAYVMALVEIVRPLTASDAVVDTAYHTAQAWGKRALIVPSTPGFVVNRVARPYYAEALRTLTAPASPAEIDAALTECGGFRMGAFALMDLIGNDINASVTRSVFEAFSYDRRFAPSLAQQALVDAGWLGRKTGRGFFLYGEGAVAPNVDDMPPGPVPSRVIAHGDLGVASALADLAAEAGLAVERVSSADARIEVDGIDLRLTDGALVAEHAHGRPSAVFDLALDYRACARIVIGAADGDTSPATTAAGFFAALGKRVSIFPDVPGLVVMRTVAAIANEATSMLAEGVGEEQIDLAMTLGTNYPLGPLAWARRIGWPHVVATLDNLSRVLGPERYTATPQLRRFALAARQSAA
jgi:3-hydroxybutyryl-CoA dehydrogenase